MINLENRTGINTDRTDYRTDDWRTRIMRYLLELSVRVPVCVPVRIPVRRVMSLPTGTKNTEHVRPSLRE